MAVEARGLGAALVAVLAPPRQCGQQQRPAALPLADAARGFQPVHARHAQVEQHDFGIGLGQLVQGILPVAGRPHAVAHGPQQFGQRVSGIGVVVCDEHAPAALLHAGRRQRGGERCRCLGCGGQRQAHGERASPADAGAVRLHAAAVQLQQPAHQGQADAQAAAGVALVRAHLGEQVEHLRQFVRRYADAAVGHGHHRLPLMS
jgi:hypothetical protein